MKRFCIRWLIVTLAIVPLFAQAQLKLPPLNEPPSSESLPGKFIWFDMAAPDSLSLQAFYGDVFGWSFQFAGKSDDDYRLIMNQGSAIGGMFQYEPPGGEQDGATWIALMATQNVDSSVAAAKQAGGSVEIDKTSTPQRGEYALLRDPAGAIFGLLDSSSGDPADEEVAVGGIIWLDLFARDPEAMTSFYSSLAPFRSEQMEVLDGVTRTLLHAHDMPRAGIIPVDEEANRSAWVPYVRVNDVEATLEKVVKGGGFAIIAPDPLILDGNVAVFVDPQGGVTGIVKWTYEGASQ